MEICGGGGWAGWNLGRRELSSSCLCDGIQEMMLISPLFFLLTTEQVSTVCLNWKCSLLQTDGAGHISIEALPVSSCILLREMRNARCSSREYAFTSWTLQSISKIKKIGPDPEESFC